MSSSLQKFKTPQKLSCSQGITEDDDAYDGTKKQYVSPWSRGGGDIIPGAPWTCPGYYGQDTGAQWTHVHLIDIGSIIL